MAQILDYGSDWKLVLDEKVNPVEEIRKPEEGYVALIGESPDTGLHMISYVLYNKEYTNAQGNIATRTVDDILQKVDDLKNCSRCSTLDKEKLNVDTIEFQSQTQPGFVAQRQQVPGLNEDNLSTTIPLSPAPAQSPIPTTPVPSDASPVRDMFSNIVVDAILTDPGKYFLGTVLNDDRMVESAIKGKKPADFAVEMFDFMEGKTDIIRSSEEAHDFLSLARETQGANSNPKAKVRKMVGPRTVIY